MITVRELSRLFKVALPAALDEPMEKHTSFRIGGPADLFVQPVSVSETIDVLGACSRESVPVLVIGGGTNLLVADRGIRGVVVDLSRLSGVQADGPRVIAQAGTPVSDVAEFARDRGLSGLEFAYSLPGTVGGAVWMNARCYGGEISDVLERVDFLPYPGLSVQRYDMIADDWGYKRSPFQSPGRFVLSAAFLLRPGDPAGMREKMEGYRDDRERKGHFLHPCAGSIFKNNREFGAPSGRLIDSLGFKGARIGAAQVAPYHGNIFINTGGARASDMRALIERVEREVETRLGFRLEREVILVGEWD